MISKEDLEALVKALNTYRYAYLGIRGTTNDLFNEEEWDYFDSITDLLIKNNLKVRN